MVEEALERRLVKRATISVPIRLIDWGILNAFSSYSIPPDCHVASCSRLLVPSSNYRIDIGMWEVFFLSRSLQPRVERLWMRDGDTG